MAKDTDKAHIFDLGEVWIADSLDTTNPETGQPFGEGWTEVGLLDGDEGFSTGRDEDTNKHYAWGGILVRKSRQKFTMTRSFTVLEDNAATRQLIWPGSTATQIKQPKPKPIKMAFVKFDGDQEVREITAKHAEVDVDGEITENESDLTKVKLIAEIYPDITDDGNVYFDVQRADDNPGDASGEG